MKYLIKCVGCDSIPTQLRQTIKQRTENMNQQSSDVPEKPKKKPGPKPKIPPMIPIKRKHYVTHDEPSNSNIKINPLVEVYASGWPGRPMYLPKNNLALQLNKITRRNGFTHQDMLILKSVGFDIATFAKPEPAFM